MPLFTLFLNFTAKKLADFVLHVYITVDFQIIPVVLMVLTCSYIIVVLEVTLT